MSGRDLISVLIDEHNALRSDCNSLRTECRRLRAQIASVKAARCLGCDGRGCGSGNLKCQACDGVGAVLVWTEPVWPYAAS